MLILLALLAGWAIWQFASDDEVAAEPADSGANVAAGDIASAETGSGAATLTLPLESGLQRAPLPAGQEPPPRHAIHGRVLRKDRSAVAGAEVRLSVFTSFQLGPAARSVEDEPDLLPIAAVLTEEDGSFRFDGPLLGDHLIQADGAGSVEYRFPIPAGDYVEIVLDSGCRVEGRVLCKEHEGELFHGEAWIGTDPFASEQLLVVPLNPDGSYVFQSLPVGTYFLGARVDGHDVMYGFKSVRLLTWGSSARLDLRAEPGVLMEGSVLDGETGAPIAGASVWIRKSKGATAMTDGAGRFRLQEIRRGALDPEDLEEIHAQAPGYERAFAPFDPKSECQIRLAREQPLPLRITGSVLDDFGRPVVGALVQVSGSKGDWRPALTQTARTDASGSFFLLWREGLQTDLGIHAASAGTFHLRLGWVTADRSLGDLHLPSLFGWDLRVTDPAGMPVAGAVLSRSRSILGPRDPTEAEAVHEPVRFIETRPTTDSFGRCRVLSDSSSAFQVKVTIGRVLGHPWEFQLQNANGPEQVLILDQLRRVPVRVLTADRQPAEDFFLIVLDAEHAMPDFGTVQGGAADMSHLFVGSAGGLAYVEGKFQREVSLVVMGEFVPEFRRHGIALDAGPIEIVLPWTATCTGRVVDAAGKPVKAATLLLLDGGKETACAETDANGKFSVMLQKGKFYALVAADASGRRSDPVAAGTNTSGLVLQIKQ